MPNKQIKILSKENEWFRPYAPLFNALKAGDICVDCGANVGKISILMAELGAQVYAFEPNPFAYQELCKAIKGYPNVVAFNKGVFNRDGFMRLYFHRTNADNPIFHSTSSSLYADKLNVNADDFKEIEVINLTTFIKELDAPTYLIKLDVEGAEYALLNNLIETGMINRVNHIIAETHAGKIPSLQAEDAILRSRIKRLGLGHKISLDWN